MDFSISCGGLSFRVSGHSPRNRSQLLLASCFAALHNHFQAVKQSAEGSYVTCCRQPVRIGLPPDTLDILLPKLYLQTATRSAEAMNPTYLGHATDLQGTPWMYRRSRLPPLSRRNEAKAGVFDSKRPMDAEGKTVLLLRTVAIELRHCYPFWERPIYDWRLVRHVVLDLAMNKHLALNRRPSQQGSANARDELCRIGDFYTCVRLELSCQLGAEHGTEAEDEDVVFVCR